MYSIFCRRRAKNKNLPAIDNAIYSCNSSEILRTTNDSNNKDDPTDDMISETSPTKGIIEENNVVDRLMNISEYKTNNVLLEIDRNTTLIQDIIPASIENHQHCNDTKSDENNKNILNKGAYEPDNKNSFENAFTIPLQFFPDKKRIKIEKSGKKKLPAVGTSDEWLKAQLKKEEQKKIIEEKTAKKKLLLEEKKKLAEEKKKLQAKLAEIQKHIKSQNL